MDFFQLNGDINYSISCFCWCSIWACWFIFTRTEGDLIRFRPGFTDSFVWMGSKFSFLGEQQTVWERKERKERTPNKMKRYLRANTENFTNFHFNSQVRIFPGFCWWRNVEPKHKRIWRLSVLECLGTGKSTTQTWPRSRKWKTFKWKPPRKLKWPSWTRRWRLTDAGVDLWWWIYVR